MRSTALGAMSGNISITTRPCFRSMYSVFSGSDFVWGSAVSLMMIVPVRLTIAAPAIRLRRCIGALLQTSRKRDSSAADALQYAFEGQRWDEGRDIASQHRHLLDQPRGDELMSLAGHQEHSLDIGGHAVVHAGHLKLVVEVRHRAQTSHDHRCPDLARKVDQQRVERQDMDH